MDYELIEYAVVNFGNGMMEEKGIRKRDGRRTNVPWSMILSDE